MIPDTDARSIAVDAFRSWGQPTVSADVRCRRLDGGWRCEAISVGTDPEVAMGASHVLVRDDGTVARCPAGALDRIAEQILSA